MSVAECTGNDRLMAMCMCRGPDTALHALIALTYLRAQRSLSFFFLVYPILFFIHPTTPIMPESLSVKMDKLELHNGIASGSGSGDCKAVKRADSECCGEDAGSKLLVVASPLKKPKAAQPPSCQVEKCEADLVAAKEYYRRHRVCEVHSKAKYVFVASLEQRFCQQCSRFHVLAEFDEAKRSCRRRLAGHNERRRKTPSDSTVDRIDTNNRLNDSWLRHMEESGRMTMLLEHNNTAKVCKEIKNH